ncbi:hypothetical protein QYE76_059677 [Lolium multiflorum]|uniref:CCHC-type domain-containing protein n=1 Tax=Lolium multiflorum TaxID=4521 RepID=A0AAD8RXL1_LOLMU|nr:hypothetical protein QYE76_059677 [Lolium multiflorum]
MLGSKKDVLSTSSKLDQAVKIAATARLDADTLRKELGQLNKKLNEEEKEKAEAQSQKKETEDLLYKSTMALLEAANIPLNSIGMKRRQASHEEERSTGREDGREVGYGVGHEDISWTRERSGSDHKIVNQENKDSADIINWREFEALRNEMRREFRAQDEELKGTVDEIKQTLDAANATVTGLADQVMDIQRNIADMLIAIENLTAQQQQQEDDEDPELEDDAHNARGAPRGHRPRGWVPLGHNDRGQDEDGLGKPKFSIPKFEGGADVEEYLTRELKIEKLWSLHPNYSENKKIKLASSNLMSGSGVSTTRNRDMLCHTCGGKGHFKRDCPNHKVMFINEDNEYETGDDVDPNAPDNDDYDTDGEDAYPSDARTIVVCACS